MPEVPYDLRSLKQVLQASYAYNCHKLCHGSAGALSFD